MDARLLFPLVLAVCLCSGLAIVDKECNSKKEDSQLETEGQEEHPAVDPLPEDENPLPEDENPLPEDENPLPEDESHLPEDENPLPEDENPLPEDENPLPEDENPLPDATAEAPFPEDETPEDPLPGETAEGPLPEEEAESSQSKPDHATEADMTDDGDEMESGGEDMSEMEEGMLSAHLPMASTQLDEDEV